ncbi:hypothetical protein BpHYR1_008691 [Brachionus plicatilis]|uniref:Uncharacterized protein n=1 Tax=Brachionus plicatilis TaxID=10195 RepID=A0A3M7RIF0_BRAPC|nr:hypothetical protein BpHYR1_008691 [Brachionus plicatilis]
MFAIIIKLNLIAKFIDFYLPQINLAKNNGHYYSNMRYLDNSEVPYYLNKIVLSDCQNKIQPNSESYGLVVDFIIGPSLKRSNPNLYHVI